MLDFRNSFDDLDNEVGLINTQNLNLSKCYIYKDLDPKKYMSRLDDLSTAAGTQMSHQVPPRGESALEKIFKIGQKSKKL